MCAAENRPAVIGLYGLPGCGKSFLLSELKRHLPHDRYNFYEGSDVISSIVPGGLEAFQKLGADDKELWRESAIETIASGCERAAKAAMVVGHFMFWSDGRFDLVCTRKDLETYTAILYLETDEDLIFEQRVRDSARGRAQVPAAELAAWQRKEVDELWRLCQENGILFARLPKRSSDRLATALKVVAFSRLAAAESNAAHVDAEMDRFLADNVGLETVVVVDADKTLSAEDTGSAFWASVGLHGEGGAHGQGSPSDVFKGPLGYSQAAFLQATLLCEAAADEETFERICDEVASGTEMHPEFTSLFRSVAAQSHVRVLVVTCGIRRVWEKVLERAGFSGTMRVLGGSRISDGLVVTADTKAQVVTRLRRQHGLGVVAIGDSPLDLPMLEAASEAIVVTGDEGTRSRSMEDALRGAIVERRLRARQTLLPGSVPPRLNLDLLPRVRLDSQEFLDALLSRRDTRPPPPRLWHASERNSARLLASPMRDGAIAGFALRKAHAQAGLYLAWEFLSEALGLEEYQTRHVQGHTTAGHRVRHEKKTTIMALMRGGEPMARGISRVMPSAIFVHAATPASVTSEHLDGQATAILVDSVINSGSTMVRFIQHIRATHATIRIVVVAGVIQREALAHDHEFARAMYQHDVTVGALRLSDNKFVGTRGTDTGHRLFNTTHMA